MTLKVLWLWGHFFCAGGEHLGHLGHLRGIWSIWGIWDICGLRASLCGLHFGKFFLRIVPVEEVISLRSSAVFGLRFSACGFRLAACAVFAVCFVMCPMLVMFCLIGVYCLRTVYYQFAA